MRERTPRQPHLQPEAIIEAALELLDAEGLESITVRALATKLGVQAPALYWHFKNKQDILDEMAQAILSSQVVAELGEPDDPDIWAPWLRKMAHALRMALLSRREGARVVAGAGLGRAQALAELAETSMRVLHRAGFDALSASLTTVTIEAYTFGFVIEEQAAPPPATSQQALDRLTTHFPLMVAAIKAQASMTADELFDWGVQAIIAGVQKPVPPTAS